MNPLKQKVESLINQNKSDKEIVETLRDEGFKDYEIANALKSFRGKFVFGIPLLVLIILVSGYFAFDYFKNDLQNFAEKKIVSIVENAAKDNGADAFDENLEQEDLEKDNNPNETDKDTTVSTKQSETSNEAKSVQKDVALTLEKSAVEPKTDVISPLSGSGDCMDTFYDNLRSCTPTRCVRAYDGFGDTVYEVKGFKNGRCEYFQDSLVEKMTCLFNESDRIKMATFQEYFYKNQSWTISSGVEYFDVYNSNDCTFTDGEIDLFGNTKADEVKLPEGNPFSTPELKQGSFQKYYHSFIDKTFWELPFTVSGSDGAELVLSSFYTMKFEGDGFGQGGHGKHNNSDRYGDMNISVLLETPGVYEVIVDLYNCANLSEADKSLFQCGSSLLNVPTGTNVSPYKRVVKYFEFVSLDAVPSEISKTDYELWSK